MGKVLVLLPTLNEELTIRNTIDDVHRYSPGSGILVIDSSSDRTAEIAEEDDAVTVLRVPKRGKGRALRDALDCLRADHPVAQVDYYVMLDGDFTYPARHVPQAVCELDDGADVVMGYRRDCEKGSTSAVHRVGNAGLSLIASVLYRRVVRDLCTGLWGFRKEVLEKFELTSDGFTLEADLFGQAVQHGYRISQIPIGYRARPDGSRAKLTAVDGFRIALFLARKRF